MAYEFKPRGVCSTMISFDLTDDKRISGLKFTDGCDGNLKALGLLTEGMPAEVVIEKLKGVKCGRKRTSCPDQLAIAIEQAMSTDNS